MSHVGRTEDSHGANYFFITLHLQQMRKFVLTQEILHTLLQAKALPCLTHLPNYNFILQKVSFQTLHVSKSFYYAYWN